ncbi:MAG: AAA family ATPase [Bryobacterales bacterium]|nr:AAA family ATPase [Bryobacterales bacterium]
MLKSLTLRKFTMFSEARLRFGKQLNVIVGENGTGKSHILKAAYSGIAVSAARLKDGRSETQAKSRFSTAIGEKFEGVFRPDTLGRLVRRGRGRNKCEINYGFDRSALDFGLTISTLSKVTVGDVPSARVGKSPVFLPTRELLTIAPGFVSLYETTHLPFEETWRDTCILLQAPLARGPRESKIKLLLEPLEEAMGGKVDVDKAGRFYLSLDSGSMEIHLVAEGLRKLATVARLIATGSLLDKGYLFWDEPESNLNPRIVKAVASTIMQLAANGIQIFIASHSLFLLRELHILQQQKEYSGFDTRCFGLHLQSNYSVEVSQGKTMDEIGDIAALDEDLEQSDRYIATEMGLITELGEGRN